MGGVIYVIVTAVTASVAAYFGSFLRKRAELDIANANFKTALGQMREQTLAVETIKTQLASDLEAIRTSNARETSFTAYRRDQITHHLEELFTSAI